MSEPASPRHFSVAEVAEAFEALSWGQACLVMMGRSARVNRLAKFLSDVAPRATPAPRRLVVTPEEARRYPPFSRLIHHSSPTWRGGPA